MTHEKQIEIRWRDMDAYQHVNNAVYATYLEECRDEWIERALGSAGDPWDFVLARVAVDFRRELVQADDVVLVRASGSSGSGVRASRSARRSGRSTGRCRQRRRRSSSRATGRPAGRGR